MGVNRPGYYKWLHRGKNQYELNRDDITNMAKIIHNEHPSYGYHVIASVIRDKTGWVISDNLVHIKNGIGRGLDREHIEKAMEILK